MLDGIKQMILTEGPAEYKRQAKELLKKGNEEEIFLRGCVFKREIPKLYNNTCCISGLRVDTAFNISMIDACHIVPFSKSYNDTVTNGIPLCPNLHRAFDRGLISIDDQYRVTLSKHFKEASVDYSIGRFENLTIGLPDKISYYPMIENLVWHKQYIFKK